jgi:hypothetical protein
MEAREGRLRIGTARKSRQGGSLPFNRRKLAASLGLPARRVNDELPMVVRRRQGHPDQYACRHDRLHLTYRVRVGGDEREDVNETVRIVRVLCRFGGARPYFVCPGVVNGTACDWRVAKLYGPGRFFMCRHCCRLAYASQSEDAQRRLDAAREQNHATPRRQCRNSLAVSAQAEGHVAANL